MLSAFFRCGNKVTVLRVLRTALRFDDLLEVLPELRKAIKFTVSVYYSERIQIKNSKWKKHIGLSPGETRY